MKHQLTSVSGGRRSVVKLLGAAAGAVVAAPFVKHANAAEPLYINTWGGLWENAASKHLFEPFTKETGTPVRTVSPVSYAKLAAQVRTGVYEFDVTTLGAAELVRANEAGLIEKIDENIIKRAALAPGQAYQNGIASHAFSTVIAYRKDKFPKGGPQNWAQFWDTKAFPGARSLQRYAARVMPLALLADGVPIDKLYPLDLDRAFKSFDRLKGDVRVWWSQGQQSQQLLRDGEVNAIAIWHGRVLELQRQNVPVELVWNQAQVDRAYWVVCKGTPRAAAAWKFIESATRPERLANFCMQADYGPLNPAAFKFIPEAQAKEMPTHPAVYQLAFEQDMAKLSPQLNELNRRFDQWVGR
jgi:putative spermidine/putrescine transport system substrate-binding protein